MDYNDVEALTKTLEMANIDTVVAAFDSTAEPNPEISLIKAADASSRTKRFIANCWGIIYQPE